MKTEYEATFLAIDPDKVKRRLQDLSARQVSKTFLQRRATFDLPKPEKSKWLRVRTEHNGITLALKQTGSHAIEDQKELEVTVSDFATVTNLLQGIGCTLIGYQENRREIWQLEGAEVVIDEWPFLEPYLEIEAENEAIVKKAALALGLDYSRAYFGSTDEVYRQKYGKTISEVNRTHPEVTFQMDNPFLGA